MASNCFGNLFKVMTFGESHGKAIGAVIDGCPSGLILNENVINSALSLRAPGLSPYTSPRKEPDSAEILSGIFNGVTTGAPIAIIIYNHDADPSKYEPIKDKLRPGHANFTYLEKYGVFDYRGGGRASARETACRVAAGAVAEEFLKTMDITIFASLIQVGKVKERPLKDENISRSATLALEKAVKLGDSLGGVVEFIIEGVPPGIGDPVYEKLEANLAKAMLSIPASKGFEIGAGFDAAEMFGSEHNDEFVSKDEQITLNTNHAGGTLGGISTGMPIVGRVAFKPTSSIKKEQKTVDLEGREAQFTLPEGSRHDPCVAIRAVPVVRAMCALVVADAMLMNRCSKL